MTNKFTNTLQEKIMPEHIMILISNIMRIVRETDNGICIDVFEIAELLKSFEQNTFNAGCDAMREDAIICANQQGSWGGNQMSITGKAIHNLPRPAYGATYPRSAQPLGANGDDLRVQNSEATPAEDKK